MNSRLVRRVLAVIVLIVLIAAILPGYHYYEYFESHVSTDDAYVDGTVALVSSRVAGTVTDVYVEDNWMVKEGQLLLTLDSRDFDVRVQQAIELVPDLKTAWALGLTGHDRPIRAPPSTASRLIPKRRSAVIDG